MQEQVIGRITNYPIVLKELLPFVSTEYEYNAIGKALVDLTSAFKQSGASYKKITPLPHKLQLLFINYSFDWLNKVRWLLIQYIRETNVTIRMGHLWRQIVYY